MLMIAAATRLQATDFVKEFRMNPNEVRIISTPEDLYGFRPGTPLILLEGWYQNDDVRRIVYLARQMQYKVFTDLMDK